MIYAPVTVVALEYRMVVPIRGPNGRRATLHNGLFRKSTIQLRISW